MTTTTARPAGRRPVRFIISAIGLIAATILAALFTAGPAAAVGGTPTGGPTDAQASGQPQANPDRPCGELPEQVGGGYGYHDGSADFYFTWVSAREAYFNNQAVADLEQKPGFISLNPDKDAAHYGITQFVLQSNFALHEDENSKAQAYAVFVHADGKCETVYAKAYEEYRVNTDVHDVVLSWPPIEGAKVAYVVINTDEKSSRR